jgi:formylglycine-generating enzyme required for sulfatase activity
MRHTLILAGILLSGFGATAADADEARAPGTVFRDCPECPEMVVIPRGSFNMGQGGRARETPVHPVTINYTFAVGKYDVTFDEWEACANAGSCHSYHPDDHGWGRGRQPVINVSWTDAQEYALWLSKKTGKHYRLLSEAEFEYVARAGSVTMYWWGDDLGQNNANCSSCGSQWSSKMASPVGSFKPNAFGVYDTSGNLTEWVEDRWNSDYTGAPADGSAWETGDPERRVMRGGSWYNKGDLQRSAYRNGDAPRVKNHKIGFRVAESL